MLGKLIITYKGIKLIPISLEFAEDIFENLTADITTYTGPKPADDISETIAFINSSVKKLETGKDYTAVIIDTETGEFFGCCGLHNIDTLTPELGVWVKKSAHGRKIGRKAIEALVNWARENIKYDYLIYPVDRRNIPSRKIPESLGGVIKDERKEINASGFELEILEYRIDFKE